MELNLAVHLCVFAMETGSEVVETKSTCLQSRYRTPFLIPNSFAAPICGLRSCSLPIIIKVLRQEVFLKWHLLLLYVLLYDACEPPTCTVMISIVHVQTA